LGLGPTPNPNPNPHPNPNKCIHYNIINYNIKN